MKNDVAGTCMGLKIATGKCQHVEPTQSIHKENARQHYTNRCTDNSVTMIMSVVASQHMACEHGADL